MDELVPAILNLAASVVRLAATLIQVKVQAMPKAPSGKGAEKEGRKE